MYICTYICSICNVVAHCNLLVRIGTETLKSSTCSRVIHVSPSTALCTFQSQPQNIRLWVNVEAPRETSSGRVWISQPISGPWRRICSDERNLIANKNTSDVIAQMLVIWIVLQKKGDLGWFFNDGFMFQHVSALSHWIGKHFGNISMTTDETLEFWDEIASRRFLQVALIVIKHAYPALWGHTIFGAWIPLPRHLGILRSGD